MSIRFSKYVRIVSGVGGSSNVLTRELIGRIITQSPLVSPDEALEFTDAASVGEYFGTDSTEYARALFYFSYTSPAISAARRIGFSRYAPTGAAPAIFGAEGEAAALAALVSANAGILSFSFNGGVAVPVTGIDLSGAVSLAAVAGLIQTALQANANPNLDNATVTYDPVAARFVFNTTVVGPMTVAMVAAGAGANDLATALAWNSPNAIVTSGVAAQTVSDAFIAAQNASNNFGSFVYNSALTLEEVAEIAAANAGLNVTYMFMVPVTYANANAWSAALIGFAGTALTLSPFAGQYPEMIPMIQLAATDYSKRNAVTNYMFKQFGGITPSVTTDAISDELDALRVNYYGQTQTAGQSLSFYQRALLMGPPSAPLDMNVYGNEQWLKDTAGAALMSLLLSAGRVPANASGRGQILAVLQDSIDTGLLNGVISVGKQLTTSQKLFITQTTNDPLAWHQVQDAGYWVDVVIVSYTGPGGTPEYKAVYTLIYSKDDAIRFIDGTHALI